MDLDELDLDTQRPAPPADGQPSASVRVMRMVTGYWTSQIVATVARLGVPEHLAAGPRTLDELVAATGADRDGLARLLRAAMTVGLLAESAADRFALTPLGQTLRADAPDSVRDYAIALPSPGFWLPYGRLLDAVVAGRSVAQDVLGAPVWDYFRDHPEEGAHFAKAMGDVSGAASREVVAHYDVSGFRRIVDLGGSEGVLLAGLLGAAPEARGVLFDLPEVVEGGREHLARRGLADRVEVVGGSFFDAVPAGGDLYLLKEVLHDWNDEQALQILHLVHEAAAPGTRLAVIEGLLPSEPQPSWLHLMNLLMLVEVGGRERTLEDFSELLQQSGYRLDRTIATPGAAYPWSVLEAVRV